MASSRDPSSPSCPRPDGLVSLPDRSPEALASFAREHHRAAARAFDSLPLEERVRMVTRASPRDRLTLILLSRDAQALTRALPGPDFFFTVKEAGDDAPDLLGLASADQIRICLDLDCWDQDVPDLQSLTGWIALLHESPETLGEVLPGIDLELLIIWLKSRIVVWKAEADGSLPEETPSGLITIDGVYYLEPLGDGEDLPLVRALLLDARARDEVFYWRLVEGTIHETIHEIEVQAFRWRESRLSDEGFPSLDDALAVYARLDPRRFRREKHRKPEPAEPGGERVAAPAALAPRPDLAGDLLLGRAWEAGLRAGGWEPIIEEMAHLLNRVLVVDGARLDAPEGVQALFHRARATLSLGLETVIDPAGERRGVYGEGEVEGAERLLREIRLDALFRLGFTRTLEVRDAALRAEPPEVPPEVPSEARTDSRNAARADADKALPSAARADADKALPSAARADSENDARADASMSEAWTAILDPPLPDAVAGAKRRRPLFYAGLSDPASTETREFRTLGEIAAGLRAMRLVAALRPLRDELSRQAVAGSLEKSSPRRAPMRLSGLTITAFAQRVLDGAAALRPIPRGCLRALHEKLFAASGPGCAEPSLRPEARARFYEAFASWLGQVEAASREDAERFLDGCLERLRVEVGVLDPDTADPLAVSAILLSRG